MSALQSLRVSNVVLPSATEICSRGQPANASMAKYDRVEGRLIVVRELQFAKARLLISVTPSGTVTEVRLEDSKQSLLMLVKPVPNVMVAREDDWKADEPISVTEFGITMLVIAEE